ncbi:MAG: PHP domain-containing protein [Saprospiraceae bacterium]
MLTNKQIASYFNELGGFMELYGENTFRTKSYKNAYIAIRKVDSPMVEMSDADISKVRGLGKSTAAKVREIIETGKMQKLEDYKSKTPVGIQEMLKIKGFGAKKVRVIWKELKTETLGELLYACNENRLIKLKGFGEKTQADLKKKIEYFLKSRDKFRYATLEAEALELIGKIEKLLPNVQVSLIGEMRRRLPIVHKIEILVGTLDSIDGLFGKKTGLELLKQTDELFYNCQTKNELPVKITTCAAGEFGSKLFKYTGTREFLEGFVKSAEGIDFSNLATEAAIFEKANLPMIPPELRENAASIILATEVSGQAKANNLPKLIEASDVKGVVHSHSTYSDGYNTLREMAEYAKAQGFEYLVITDHSKSAFYANGLKSDRVLAQMAEIDELNVELAPFKIFKSIESDILNNGSLDYEDEILAKFDMIIASVHTNLKMDIDKATTRLITAIENPYTTMLGHPTGRLLLSREGYPIDYKKVIDACAANNVSIEINANPYRLDLDWTWIEYATSQGVKISINPDAHSTAGIHDIHFGTLVARKGGLTADNCLNALGVEAFDNYLAERKKRKEI